MTNEKTGGPAYPITKDNGFGYEYTVPGNLTILDHFAGLAMQGILSRGEAIGEYSVLATLSYRCAAAMITERNRIMNEP